MQWRRAGGVRAAHGAELVEENVSTYHVVGEIARVYEGMMIALPPREWAIFQEVGAVEFAEFLQAAAELAWLAKYPLSHRGPKKPRPETNERQEESSCRHRPPLGSEKST